MSWDRKQRQEAILREKIALIILDRLSDPRLGFITITNVELSKDKKIAKIFYTVLGTDAQVRKTAHALADGRGRVQEMLAPTLNMRSMPELRFIFNESVQRESKLLDLIGGVTAERIERAGPDEDLGVGPGLGDEESLGRDIFDFEALSAAVGEQAEEGIGDAPGEISNGDTTEDTSEDTSGPDDCPEDPPGELPPARGAPSP